MKRLWSRREKQRTSTKPSELVWMLISHISSHKSELRRAKRRGEKSGKEKGNSELLYGSKYILQYNTFKNPETKITKEHFQKVKLFFFVWSHSSQSRVALFCGKTEASHESLVKACPYIFSNSSWTVEACSGWRGWKKLGKMCDSLKSL